MPSAGSTVGSYGLTVPSAGAASTWEPPTDAPAALRWTTNSARLLVDRHEVFPAMEAMAARAQRLIQIDYYIFSGQQAQRLANILKQKAREGVRVEMMLDPKLGTLPAIRNKSLPIVRDLLANGVALHEYPLDKLRRQVGHNTNVDHNKILVIDSQEAIIGGMNIADPFLNNHDLMVELRGPAAQDLSQNLRHDFFQSQPFKTKQVLGADAAQVRINSFGLGRNFNEEAVLTAIDNARQSIHVLMFQLTHERTIEALKDAHERGVDVKVLLDPGNHDSMVPIINKAPKGYPNLPAALELKKAGVPVRWFKLKPGMEHMHAKAAVIDGETAFVGSTNWTTNGFSRNNETSLEIRGGLVPSRLQQVIREDWNYQSLPVDDDQKVLAGLKSWLIRKIYFP